MKEYIFIDESAKKLLQSICKALKINIEDLMALGNVREELENFSQRMELLEKNALAVNRALEQLFKDIESHNNRLKNLEGGEVMYGEEDY